MCTKAECERHIGQWVRFRTPYGVHEGVIERVTPESAIILSPKHYVPVELASTAVSADEVKRIDAALAWWGGLGRPGFAGPRFGPGYPGKAPYGGGYGPSFGYWGFGWARWAVSFLVIFLLWGLLLWW